MPAPKILLVEDDINLSTILKVAFERSGFTVEQAFNGEEAFKALNDEQFLPDIILLDIIMPTLDGFGFMKKLRGSVLEFSHIPVMALTSLSQKADFEKMMSHGTVDYLVKSDYEPQQIVTKVKEMLKRFE